MPAEPLVAVVGSVNIDLTVTTATFPRPGQTVLADDLRRRLGGKGANQAVAAALAGARVCLLGRVGDDAGGRWALERLAAQGVDVQAVRTTPAPTGIALITVAAGENTIVVAAGANAAWHDGLDTDEATVAAAAVVLAQQEIPPDVVARAAGLASGRFILNASPSRDIDREVLVRCDPLLVNEQELGDLTGSRDVAASHRALIGHGARSVVTTLGAAGALVSDAGGDVHIAGIPAVVVDTTGAGDAFAGTLAAVLATGTALADAVRLAVAAGSLAVRRAGAQDSYRPLAEIQALLRDG